MARIIQSEFPIDLTPSVAVGYGFPLDGNAVFIPTFTTREQLKANLVNYLLTNKGERLFRPDFGGDLRNCELPHKKHYLSKLSWGVPGTAV